MTFTFQNLIVSVFAIGATAGLALAVRTIARVVRLRREFPFRCPRCDYPVQSIAPKPCSECGTGISRSSLNRRTSLAVIRIGASLLIAIGLAGAAAFSYAPRLSWVPAHWLLRMAEAAPDPVFAELKRRDLTLLDAEAAAAVRREAMPLVLATANDDHLRRLIGIMLQSSYGRADSAPDLALLAASGNARVVEVAVSGMTECAPDPQFLESLRRIADQTVDPTVAALLVFKCEGGPYGRVLLDGRQLVRFATMRSLNPGVRASAVYLLDSRSVQMRELLSLAVELGQPHTDARVKRGIWRLLVNNGFTPDDIERVGRTEEERQLIRELTSQPPPAPSPRTP